VYYGVVSNFPKQIHKILQSNLAARSSTSYLGYIALAYSCCYGANYVRQYYAN